MDSEGSGGNSGDDHRSDHIGGHASFWIYLIVVYGGCWKIGSEIWYGWLSTRCRKKFFVDTRCIVNVTQLLLFNLVGFPVLGAVVGIPVVLRFLLYSLLQGLWRLAVAVASVPVEWAKRVYVRRQQAAIDYLSNFPDESKRRWRSRGWLGGGDGEKNASDFENDDDQDHDDSGNHTACEESVAQAPELQEDTSPENTIERSNTVEIGDIGCGHGGSINEDTNNNIDHQEVNLTTSISHSINGGPGTKPLTRMVTRSRANDEAQSKIITGRAEQKQKARQSTPDDVTVGKDDGIEKTPQPMRMMSRFRAL
eukprot:g9173.t1